MEIQLDRTLSMSELPGLTLPRLPSLPAGPSGDLVSLLPGLDDSLRATASGLLEAFLHDGNLQMPAQPMSKEQSLKPVVEMPPVVSGGAAQPDRTLDAAVVLPSVATSKAVYPPTTVAVQALPEQEETLSPTKRAAGSKDQASGTASESSSYDTKGLDGDHEDCTQPDIVADVEDDEEYHPGDDSDSKRRITRSESRRCRNTSVQSTDATHAVCHLRSQPGEELVRRPSLAKEKRKVGRPIAYKGDPNSTQLTEDERRRIKRRIANRESARRVRQKRLEVMDELQLKIQAMQAHNQRLTQHAAEVEQQHSLMLRQMHAMREQWTVATNDNARLQGEVQSLRSTLELTLQRPAPAPAEPPPAPVTQPAIVSQYAASSRAATPLSAAEVPLTTAGSTGLADWGFLTDSLGFCFPPSSSAAGNNNACVA